MDDLKIGDTPFNVLMQQAVKMKSSRHAVDRRRFDGLPRFAQNSMFGTELLVEKRQRSFDERLSAAETLKEEGNALFRTGGKGAWMECGMKYENAVAVFRYIENVNPKWRKSCIDDQDMVYHDFVTGENETGSEDQRRKAAAVCLSCYLNLAAVYTKLGDFQVAIHAADYALALDGANAKALYRRAMARYLPKSAGAADVEAALGDMNAAAAAAPDDATIRKAAAKLKSEVRHQRDLDKNTFGNLFDRGELYREGDVDPAENAKRALTSAAPADRDPRPWAQQLHEAEAIKRQLEEDGELEQAKEVQDIIEAATRERAARAEAPPAPIPTDFRHPTAAMIAEAKAKGIDLTDPRVVDMLVDLQERRARGEDVMSGGGATAKAASGAAAADGGDDEDAEALTASDVVEVLDTMDEAKVAEMLAQHGMSTEVTVASKRNLAEAVAEGMRSSKFGRTRSRHKPSLIESFVKLGFWQRALFIGLILMLFRIWHMGLLWRGLAILAEASGYSEAAEWFDASYHLAGGRNASSVVPQGRKGSATGYDTLLFEAMEDEWSSEGVQEL